MNFDAKTIAQATGGVLTGDAGAGPIQTDTRKLTPGAWFLAIRGDRFDGHDFMQAAIDAGAAGVIISREVPEWTGAAVVVDDTTKALQDLGNYARSKMDVPVIGLTGSAGKTTTRALIALAMSPLGAIHQTVGNLNNHWGVPMTLVATPDDTDGLVVEMGTSGPGEIEVLARIAEPTVRVIVNIGPSHLMELGGLEGVAREKGRLFDTARDGDVLCINLDDPFITAMALPTGARVITYGVHPDAQIRLVNTEVRVGDLHTVCAFETDEGAFSVDLPAPGEHFAHNAAAALAVAKAVGIPLADAGAALEQYEPVGMRMRAEELPGGAVALNDTYNANPSSMAASLNLLSKLPGRRAAVLGTMGELGRDEDKWHAHIATLAGELELELVVLVGEAFGRVAPFCEGAGNVWVFRDVEEAVYPLKDWIRSGDHVLFKGSRSTRMERVLHGVQGRGA